jgi:hypothetical protein
MGRQIRFRMGQEDLASFVRRLDEVEAVLLPYRNQGPEPVPLNDIGERREGLVWLARPADLDRVRFTHVAAQGYWAIDQTGSPVVEFTPGGRNGAAPGRLYFETGYFDETGRRADLPAGFVGWADGLLRWIRRNFRHDRASGLYVGPGASEPD